MLENMDIIKVQKYILYLVGRISAWYYISQIYEDIMKI